ncbi:uncharacterized protein METZ01_LOCUS206546, partial [marine metagenome]
AMIPEYIIGCQYIADIVKKKDQKKCNCKSNLK